MNRELEGVEELSGTYPFDLHASYRARKINRFLWNLRLTEYRDTFVADEDAAMRAAGLNDTERDLVRRRDWLGMIQYGVCFFLIEKIARVVKVTNLEMYAIMRGETFEDFLKTRRVPDAR
jgi:Aromatic-ring-opening dioxygenase LigAB, LigA subunit